MIEVMCLPLLAGAALLAFAASVGPAASAPITFSYTGTLETYTAPIAGSYRILAYGAAGGGNSLVAGGLGAEIGGVFSLTAGEMLTIAVGGTGSSPVQGSPPNVTGGGGGSFVIAPGTLPLVIAGGGGGGAGRGSYQNVNGQTSMDGSKGGQSGSGAGGTGGSGGSGASIGGGGGLNGSGGTAPSAPSGHGGGGYPSLIGGAGGNGNGFSGPAVGGSGGFGGGGGGDSSGGGGGGYSGGGGGSVGTYASGGGGGSFLAANANDPLLLSGVNSGDGLVTIDFIPPTTVPEPVSLSLLGLGVLGLGLIRRRKAE